MTTKEGLTEIAPLLHSLSLKLTAEFYEDEKAEVPAPSIVYAEEAYYVKVKWWFEGHVGFARHFCGTWQVKIDLESIGKAEEYTSPLIEVPMDPCNFGTKEKPYEHIFELTPGLLKPSEGGSVYKVAVTLSSLDQCGDPGHIWGFVEGDSVMFVEATPQ
jgi:hypothetical protein